MMVWWVILYLAVGVLVTRLTSPLDPENSMDFAAEGLGVLLWPASVLCGVLGLLASLGRRRRR
jgi:hypothetical protein